MNPNLKIKKEQLSIEDRLKNIEEYQDFIEFTIMGISETLDETSKVLNEILKFKIDNEKKIKAIDSHLKVLNDRTKHIDKFTFNLCRN